MTNRGKRLLPVWLILVGALALSANTNANAGMGGGHGHRGGHAGMGRFGPGGAMMGMMRGLHGLDLSDEQRDAVHQVMERYREPLMASSERLRALRTTARDMAHADAFDEAELSDVAGQIGAETATVVGIRVHMGAEIDALLTPEQRRQLVENGQP